MPKDAFIELAERRLAELDKSIDRVVKQRFGGDRIPDHHQAKIDEIREKQREVRAQLKQAKTGKRTFWSEVARGLEEDIDGATRRYHRWLEDIDTET